MIIIDEQFEDELPDDEQPEKERARPPSRPPAPGPPRVSWPRQRPMPQPHNEPVKPRNRPATMRH